MTKTTQAGRKGAAQVAPPQSNKLATITALLGRPEGARLEELQAATGWQAHSVRGAMSGALKKKRRFNITSEKTEKGLVYKITDGAGA
jgi:hypothetical protein